MTFQIFDNVLVNGKEVTYLGMEDEFAKVGWLEGNEYHWKWVEPERVEIIRRVAMI